MARPTFVETAAYDQRTLLRMLVSQQEPDGTDVTESVGVPSAPFVFVANGVAAICLPENEDRILATLTNQGSVNVWFGSDATVTSENGVRYYPDTGFDDYISTAAWWVITEGGECQISVHEFTRAQS